MFWNISHGNLIYHRAIWRAKFYVRKVWRTFYSVAVSPDPFSKWKSVLTWALVTEHHRLNGLSTAHICFLSSGGWKVQGQGAGRFGVWWERILIHGWPFSRWVPIWQKWRGALLSLFHMGTQFHSWGLDPSWLNHFLKGSHFLIPSHWGLG